MSRWTRTIRKHTAKSSAQDGLQTSSPSKSDANSGRPPCGHPELARRPQTGIWFCDPHAPWQRGDNENTNGFPRQFMPKGTDLCDASQTRPNDVAAIMNNRPGKNTRLGENPRQSHGRRSCGLQIKLCS